MWYLEIFLATELKYFSFLIFLQFNLTKMHFLYSLCQAFPWTLVIQWWTIYVWIILLLTWLCMIILLPLVIHGKMTVFVGRIHVYTFGQFNTNLVNHRDIMRGDSMKKKCLLFTKKWRVNFDWEFLKIHLLTHLTFIEHLICDSFKKDTSIKSSSYSTLIFALIPPRLNSPRRQGNSVLFTAESLTSTRQSETWCSL